MGTITSKVSLCCLLFYMFADMSVTSCEVSVHCSCCADKGLSCNAAHECGGPCKDGYWGSKCIMACPAECVSCSQFFGRTNDCYSCIDGNYGQNCSDMCPRCMRCIKDTGVCTSCAVGYYGTSCQHRCSVNCLELHCYLTAGRCNQCIGGHFGDMCNNKCSVTCNDSSCDRDSGKCHACIDGYYGEHCNISCNSNCSACRMSSGMCSKCVAGTYGHFCVTQCPLTCKDSLCDRYLGTCTNGCIENFTGVKCEVCQTGKYGDTCSLQCPSNCNNNNCHRYNGTCVSGCKPGYSDIHFCCVNSTNCLSCSSDIDCEHCANGTYGLTCGSTCPVNCDGPCDRSTGDCIQCKLNYYGSKCKNNCSETCLMTDYQIARCVPDNGFCTFGCNSGFFGNMCEQSCSANCNDSCDQQSGECFNCKVNRFGTVCEHICSYTCVRRDHEAVCSKDTGHCLHGCINGSYGNVCGNNCSSGCNDNACNSSTGYCTNGCAEGLGGPFCNDETGQSFSQATDAFPTTTVGVGVGVGVTLVVAVAVFTLVIRRRRSEPKQISKKTTGPAKEKARKNTLPGKTKAVDEDVFVPKVEQVEIRDEHTYYNTVSLKLKTEDLNRYLSKSDVDYQKEFLMLPTGLIKPYTEAKTPGNARKNRYNMVYPYDDSRVRVKDGNSDYINASYIDGYKKRNAYIACLGPTTKILGDFSLFWKMVWQEKVETIVMVTKLKEASGMKCDQYWPNAGKTMMYGNVKVISTSEEEYAEFIVRSMTISVDREERPFHHIHFTAWPDKGVPSDVISIVNLRNKVLRMRRKFDGPLIVHCSAGIGRTGTFIALDILIRQGQTEQSVDVLGCVIKMRQQRVHMVQTVTIHLLKEQYKYLHHAVLWSLSIDTEPIPADRFTNLSWIYQNTGLTKLLKQLQMENWYDTEEEKRAVEAHNMIPFANRENADIPGSRHAVRVMKYDTNQQMKADYINAVFIDGYKRQNRFIAAQTPLPETVTQFLDMVAQQSVGCIIDLEPSRINQDDVGEYLPEEGQELQNGNVVFKTTRRKEFGAYVKHDIRVIEDEKVHNSRVIAHYQFARWSQSSLVPDSGEFVKLIHDVENLVIQTEQTGPILVHCMNGADRSALFCAIWLLIERIGIDYSVSVMNTLRQVKSRRRMAIPNEEQVEFCFKGVATHLNLLDQNVYSNM